MRLRHFMLGCFIFLTLLTFLLTPNTRSQTSEKEVVFLSDSIGPEIDAKEKQTYRLFPDIKGFQSAKIFRLSGSKLRLTYSYLKDLRLQEKSTKISSDAFQLTQLHVRLTDEYLRVAKLEPQAWHEENVLLYRLALKYASQTRYDLTSQLLDDLVKDYPNSAEANKTREFQPGVRQILRSKKALIWKGSLLDQSGRTDLLIFSGYYGVWLGIATPIALDATSAEAYGTGLLLGGPLSLLFAHQQTKDANVSRGKATIISLGGHLGTWQGIGWSAISDKEAEEVIGIGELGGLAGIAMATLLANQVDFTEGHASLTSSGLQWGAWFGAVAAGIAEVEEGDAVVRDMLIGSDLMVLGTGIVAKDVLMSRARVRLINLGGVLGTVFGFGIDLLVQPEETSTTMAIAGLGSIGGLILGTQLTKNYDKGKELTYNHQVNPSLHLFIAREDQTKPVLFDHAFHKESSNSRRETIPGMSLIFRF